MEHNIYDVFKAQLHKISPKEYFVTGSKKDEKPSLTNQSSVLFSHPSHKMTAEKEKTDPNPTVK